MPSGAKPPGGPTTQDFSPFQIALRGVCPRCGKGRLYKPGRLTTTVNESCAVCGLPIGRQDSADAPAVLLMFFLGALLVPLALLLEFTAGPPLWLHAVLWGGIAIGLTLGALRPMKAFVIALQYKHRPEDLERNEKPHSIPQDNAPPNGPGTTPGAPPPS